MKDYDPDAADAYMFIGCKDHDDPSLEFDRSDTLSFQFQVTQDIPSAYMMFMMDSAD